VPASSSKAEKVHFTQESDRIVAAGRLGRETERGRIGSLVSSCLLACLPAALASKY
jgi:hypothetical protein